ncbi:MAG: efflux RND transporter periplasmic adaptor subunit [Candidatus Paceibacterota bacterium]
MLKTMFKKINFKNKKYLIGGGVFLILLILIISGGKKDDSSLIRGSVTRGEVSSIISLSGKVESSNDVSLRFNTSGTIQNIYVTEGQKVKEGDRLMSLDNRSLSADLLKAQANLDLQKAQSKVSNAEVDSAVESAYIALLNNDLQAYPKNSQQDYSATPPVVSGFYKGKKEGVYNLDVYASNSQSGYSFRYSGLEPQDTGTINEYSVSKLGELGLYLQFDSESNYGSTEWVIPIPNNRSTTYASALNNYNEALAKRDASENSNVSVEISNAKIKQAEAEVARIQADINERILRAPFNGTVSFIGPSKGEIAVSTETAISLISEENYEIKIQIPEVDLSKIKINQISKIELDAYPGENFTGYVVSIDPAETIIDGVSVYEASVYFDEQNPKIKSGMTANVNIFSDKKENVLRIQKQFIEKDEMGEYVFVYMEGEQVKTYIQTGFVGGDGFVEVVSGLLENDIIIGKFE